MIIWEVTWGDDEREYTEMLRDPYWIGRFLHGIPCNERGIAIRQEGCTGSELLIRRDRLRSHVIMEPATEEESES